LITAAVQRQTAGLFVAEDRGQHELKGVSAPTTLYRVVRASGGGRRGGGRQRFGADLPGEQRLADLEHTLRLIGLDPTEYTTPSLMGFGNDPDKLVVIADAAESGTNAVAFWRDEIPPDFKQKPGTKSRRIADQARIEISQLTIEPSPNVLGYEAVFINGSHPKPVKTPGFPNAFNAGVTRPAPLGVEKFEWNPKTRQLEKAWINREVDNSDIMVPVVSAATGCSIAPTSKTATINMSVSIGKLERYESVGYSPTTAACGMRLAASRRSSKTATC
jgi:hypothetical protein